MRAPRALGIWILAVSFPWQPAGGDTVVERQQAACTGLLPRRVSPALESNFEVL